MYKILLGLMITLTIISCSDEPVQDDYDFGDDYEQTELSDSTITEEPGVKMTKLGEYLMGAHPLKPIGYRDLDGHIIRVPSVNPIYYKLSVDDGLYMTFKMIDNNDEEQIMVVPFEMVRLIEDNTVDKPYIKFRWNYQSNKSNKKGLVYIIEKNLQYINIVASKRFLPQLL